MSYSGNTVNDANKSDLFPSLQKTEIDPDDPQYFSVIEDPVDNIWKPFSTTLLEKYNVSDWKDMEGLVVEKDDARMLLQTAVFLFHNGATIKTNKNKSYKGKQAWKCDSTNCYWQCAWKKAKKSFGNDKLIFVTPYTEACNRQKAFEGSKKFVTPSPIDTHRRQ